MSESSPPKNPGEDPHGASMNRLASPVALTSPFPLSPQCDHALQLFTSCTPGFGDDGPKGCPKTTKAMKSFSAPVFSANYAPSKNTRNPWSQGARIEPQTSLPGNSTASDPQPRPGYSVHGVLDKSRARVSRGFGVGMPLANTKSPGGLPGTADFGRPEKCGQVPDAQYCMVQQLIYLNAPSSLPKQVSRVMMNHIGLCLPSVCTGPELEYFVRYFLGGMPDSSLTLQCGMVKQIGTPAGSNEELIKEFGWSGMPIEYQPPYYATPVTPPPVPENSVDEIRPTRSANRTPDKHQRRDQPTRSLHRNQPGAITTQDNRNPFLPSDTFSPFLATSTLWTDSIRSDKFIRGTNDPPNINPNNPSGFGTNAPFWGAIGLIVFLVFTCSVATLFEMFGWVGFTKKPTRGKGKAGSASGNTQTKGSSPESSTDDSGQLQEARAGTPATITIAPSGAPAPFSTSAGNSMQVASQALPSTAESGEMNLGQDSGSRRKSTNDPEDAGAVALSKPALRRNTVTGAQEALPLATNVNNSKPQDEKLSNEKIIFETGQEFQATLVGSDPRAGESDLAPEKEIQSMQITTPIVGPGASTQPASEPSPQTNGVGLANVSGSSLGTVVNPGEKLSNAKTATAAAQSPLAGSSPAKPNPATSPTRPKPASSPTKPTPTTPEPPTKPIIQKYPMPAALRTVEGMYFLTVMNNFSLLRNARQLLGTRPVDYESNCFACIDSIRGISMLQVILGHSFVWGMQTGLWSNYEALVPPNGLFSHGGFQLVLASFYAVDSFFVMSGFLCCLSLHRKHFKLAKTSSDKFSEKKGDSKAKGNDELKTEQARSATTSATTGSAADESSPTSGWNAVTPIDNRSSSGNNSSSSWNGGSSWSGNSSSSWSANAWPNQSDGNLETGRTRLLDNYDIELRPSDANSSSPSHPGQPAVQNGSGTASAAIPNSSKQAQHSAKDPPASATLCHLAKMMPMFVFNRWLRLVVTEMFVILIAYAVVPELSGSGMMWYMLRASPIPGEPPGMCSDFTGARPCATEWWRNLVFIQNFEHRVVENPNPKMCCGVTWYLAVDMQLYLTAPLFCCLYKIKALFGWIALGIGILASVVSPMISAWYWDYVPDEMAGGSDYVNWDYSMPWTRASPFYIGIGLAWLWGTRWDPKTWKKTGGAKEAKAALKDENCEQNDDTSGRKRRTTSAAQEYATKISAEPSNPGRPLNANYDSRKSEHRQSLSEPSPKDVGGVTVAGDGNDYPPTGRLTNQSMRSDQLPPTPEETSGKWEADGRKSGDWSNCKSGKWNDKDWSSQDWAQSDSGDWNSDWKMRNLNPSTSSNSTNSNWKEVNSTSASSSVGWGNLRKAGERDGNSDWGARTSWNADQAEWHAGLNSWSSYNNWGTQHSGPSPSTGYNQNSHSNNSQTQALQLTRANRDKSCHETCWKPFLSQLRVIASCASEKRRSAIFISILALALIAAAVFPRMEFYDCDVLDCMLPNAETIQGQEQAGSPVPRWLQFAWAGLSRPLWSVGLALIMVLCFQRRFLPILQNVLHQKFWQPVAKLCYSMYLCHPIILTVYYCSFSQLQEFSAHAMLGAYITFFVGTMLMAFIVHLLVEKPFGNLQAALLGG